MGDTPKSCAEALLELTKAQARASERWVQFVSHGDKNPEHAKALAQALIRLQKAIDAVKSTANVRPRSQG